MDFLKLFDDANKPWQLLIYIVVFVACMNLEYFIGVSDKEFRFKNIRTNLLFIIPGFLFQTLLGFVFIKTLDYENIHNLGIFSMLHIKSFGAQVIISFIVLDFFYWLYHFVMHRYGGLWRFHAVHHSDKVLNVSTSLREHPIETTVRLSHYMIISCLLGPAVLIISLHQFIQVISKIIIHSNWRLPEKTDKILSYLVLTPNMHHVHHHEKQPYTDSNYGDLFSIWDRMFATFQHLNKSEVVFGLDLVAFENRDSKNLKFKGLMSVPFSKQKLDNK